MVDGTDDTEHGSGSGVNAWNTLQYALEQIDAGLPGDYILRLAAGTFSADGAQQISINQNLTIFGAVDPDGVPTTILDGSDAVNWIDGLRITSGAGEVTVQDLTIRNFKTGILINSDGGCVNLNNVNVTLCERGLQLVDSYQVTLDLLNSQIFENTTGLHVTAGSSNNRILNGFLSNNTGDGIRVEGEDEVPDENRFEEIEVSNNLGNGIIFYDGFDNVVSNCLIRGNNSSETGETGYAGIAVLTGNTELKWNTIEDNACAGVYADEATSLEVSGNLIRGNEAEGINLSFTSDVKIFSNTITENLTGVVVEEGSSPEVAYNIIWGNGDPGTDLLVNGSLDRLEFNDIETTNLAGLPPTNITFDPKFTNPIDFDYTLLSDSPCIDATDLTTAGEDRAGLVRPQGNAWDIGAFESLAYADTDGDGLPDWWENDWFGGLDVVDDPNGDYDNDGISNWNESRIPGSDPTSPVTVAITSPESSPSFTGGELDFLTVTGISSSAAGVDVTNNGVSVTPVDFEPVSGNWSADVNLSSGANLIRATASSSADDGSANASMTVISDSSPPTVSIIEPTNEGAFTTPEGSITLSGIAGDDAQEISLSWECQAVNTGVITNGAVTGAESWASSSILLEDGDNIITVTATDQFEKTASATIIITLALEPDVAHVSQDLSQEGAQPEGDSLDSDGDEYLNADETNPLCNTDPNDSSEESLPANSFGRRYPIDPSDRYYEDYFDPNKIKQDENGNPIGYRWPDCLNPDDDNDGLLDDCEEQYFDSSTSSQGPADDFDGDEESNLEECLNGTDPTQMPPAAGFTLTITDLSPDQAEDYPPNDGLSPYDMWLPGFGKVVRIEATWSGDGDPGSAIFSLEDTSNYPGRSVNDPTPAMLAVNNYPPGYEYNGYDFGIVATAPSPGTYSYAQGPLNIEDSADGTSDDIYTIYLQCWDYGGRTKLVVTHPSDSTIKSEIWLPKGSGVNGIGRYWIHDRGATRLDANKDMDAIIFTPENTKFSAPFGDDFNNFEEYRGIIHTYRASEEDEVELRHLRLNPRRKDLFIRAIGFDDSIGDPYRPFSPPEDASGNPQYDNYYPFRLGLAFANAGIDVHNTTSIRLPTGTLIGWGHDATEDGSFYIYSRAGNITGIEADIYGLQDNVTVTGSSTGWAENWPKHEWEFKLDGDSEAAWTPVALRDSPTELTLDFSYPGGDSGNYAIRKPLPHINILIVRHDRVAAAAIPGDDGYIKYISVSPASSQNPLGNRRWIWSHKGYSRTNDTIDLPFMYGLTVTLQNPIDHYFGDRPYMKETLWTGSSWVPADALASARLGPLSQSEDPNETGGPDVIDGYHNDSAGILVGNTPNNIWDGDRRLLTHSEWETIGRGSPFDIDNDGIIEMPFGRNPDAINPDYEQDLEGRPYTKARVLTFVAGHEIGHALGGPSHSKDNPLCMMYKISENYNRDNFLSDYYRSLLRIHNKMR